MNEVKMLFPGGKTHAVTLSYDDGVIYDERLVGMLRESGMKGTFYLNSGGFAPEEGTSNTRMTREQCLRVYDPAVCEIAMHTVHHTQLNAVPGSVAAAEVLLDRIALEKIFDRPVHGLGYPVSQYPDALFPMFRQLGVFYARGGDATKEFELPDNFMKWMPTCRHASPDLPDVCDAFLAKQICYTGPFVFMLMGHSYEFENSGNWYVMENFLKKMRGHDFIWYATCLEIYECRRNFERLEFSADGKRVYNPSAAEVWVLSGNERIRIPGGGQTIL